jgi:S-adenosylmethionine:tRNA-ribosyltransferase-isomerase (queuine synthetase)
MHKFRVRSRLPRLGYTLRPELLEQCRQQGIQQASVTLHVGIGTFRPVEVEDITHHAMHGEWLEVPPVHRRMIRATKASGGRVIAVGTTVVRALEGAAWVGNCSLLRVDGVVHLSGISVARGGWVDYQFPLTPL